MIATRCGPAATLGSGRSSSAIRGGRRHGGGVPGIGRTAAGALQPCGCVGPCPPWPSCSYSARGRAHLAQGDRPGRRPRGRCRLRPPGRSDSSKVQVRVYNATAREGLARKVAGQLVGRGYAIVATDNDPLSGIRPVDGAAEVRYGPAGARAAALVRRQVPGATLYKDARQGATVDLVLGEQFRRLSTPAELARGRQGLLAGRRPLRRPPAPAGVGEEAGPKRVHTGHDRLPRPRPRAVDRRRLPAQPGRVPVRQRLAPRGPGAAGRRRLRPGVRRALRRHGVRGAPGLAGARAAAARHRRAGRRGAGRPAVQGAAVQPRGCRPGRCATCGSSCRRTTGPGGS